MKALVRERESATYGVSDMTSIFKCSEGTLHRYVRKGKLPAPVKIGQKLLWSRAAVNKILGTEEG